MTSSTDCRIYVACLASYNAGRLHGEWIDATDADEIQEQVAKMLRASPYPNVTVECPNLDDVNAKDETGRHRCDECKGLGYVPSAEEWAIHDFEGFEGYKIEEYESFANVAKLAELIESHGAAIVRFLENGSADLNDTDLEDKFSESFQGEHRSVEAYAEEYLDDTGALHGAPDLLSRYFDYEAFARDLELGGDIWTAEAPSGVYIFNNY